MLFFRSLNLTLILLSSFISPLERSLFDYRDAFTFEDVEDESRIVMEAFRTVPSGLRMLLRMSENS
jgi:hypothetical protein